MNRAADLRQLGPLDLLVSIGVRHSYEDLVRYIVELEVSDLRLRILCLERLIEAKKHTATD